MKSIAIFDIDNTIYRGHSYFGIVKYFVEKGIIDQSTYDQVMDGLGKYRAKEQTYGEAANNLLNILSKALKGKEYEVVNKLVQEFFKNEKQNFYPYFLNILPKLKETHEVYLVTANGQMVAETIVKMFGLDGYLSTVFEIKDGLFTGKVSRSLADGKTVCIDLIKSYSGETIGVGDSENDLGIFETVKHPICMNPTDGLLLVAKKRKWAIVNENTIEEEIQKILA